MKSRLKPILVFTVLASAGALMFFAGKATSQIRDVQSARSLPIILDRIQAIGELHTAKQNAETVIDMETHREPDGWARGTPIASLVQATTTNRALVSVKGSVEAGVDLSSANASFTDSPEGRTLVVQLPPVTLYEPNVTGEVHSARRGLMWKDDGISLKALAEAKTRFAQSARQGGLTEEAEENARKTLETLLKPLHDGPMTITFGTSRT